MLSQAIVKRSSLIIADLVGCFDPATAVSYLALFQVLTVSPAFTLHTGCSPSLELYSISAAVFSADQCSV